MFVCHVLVFFVVCVISRLFLLPACLGLYCDALRRVAGFVSLFVVHIVRGTCLLLPAFGQGG